MPIVAVIPQPNAPVELREVPEAELEASLPSRKNGWSSNPAGKQRERGWSKPEVN